MCKQVYRKQREPKEGLEKGKKKEGKESVGRART
jgi:hypothetical protein